MKKLSGRKPSRIESPIASEKLRTSLGRAPERLRLLVLCLILWEYATVYYDIIIIIITISSSSSSMLIVSSSSSSSHN